MQKSFKLIAVRHGESEHNIKGVINGDPKIIFHLSGLGKVQAQQIAENWSTGNIKAIIVSEMLRTQETALPLANKLNLPLQIDSRLNDIYAGGLEGMPIEKFRLMTSNAKIKIQNSETSSDVARRIKSFLEDMLNQYDGQTIVIFSSEIIIHSLQQIIQGKSCDEALGDHIQNAKIYEFIITSPIKCLSC